MSRTKDELLREALVHLELAASHADARALEQIVIDAICMRLSAGIEVLGRLEPEVRAELFGDEWPVMWGMRNRIAHGYVLVSADIVRRTADADLPEIIAVVRRACIEG